MRRQGLSGIYGRRPSKKRQEVPRATFGEMYETIHAFSTIRQDMRTLQEAAQPKYTRENFPLRSDLRPMRPEFPKYERLEHLVLQDAVLVRFVTEDALLDWSHVFTFPNEALMNDATYSCASINEDVQAIGHGVELRGVVEIADHASARANMRRVSGFIAREANLVQQS